ncbi:MAG: glycerol-3-phosphate dehydrogenase/oxidase [Bacteroidia bacterium]
MPNYQIAKLNSFSAKNRNTIIKQLSCSSFDVLIIGGGITGAGIALDASARGLKVALIEMQDFASGTSGRSTKLIHGGLRYLKQLELKLVAEVGKEREIIHRIAPHLTKPERMLLPIVKNGSLGKYSARVGMWLYEWLAGVKKDEQHKVLTIEETFAAEPLLRKDNLLGGIVFYEYRTDDARLTIEVMKEAVSRGALAINYTKAKAFIYKDTNIVGVKVVNQFTNETYEINAKHVINAAGPWVDTIDDLEKTPEQHKLHITKGVHIVVDAKKLPVKQSVYFDTDDKRMIFVIPRDEKTYIGTTDTFYDGDLANPEITIEDKTYLLNCVNSSFSTNKLSLTDIESGWAGLRPLINKPGKGPSEISRKDEVFISPSGLITIAGGKLTGYRKMAQRVVDIVTKVACTTHNIQLSGGKISKGITFSEFVKSKTAQGLALGLTVSETENLINRYGSNIDELYTIVENLKEEKSELLILLRAQLIYAVEKEMCCTPSDFFIRRTSLLYFDIETVKKYSTQLALYMKAFIE